MSTLCEPKISLSICDNNVKIAESNTDVRLIVYKGVSKQCDIELTPILGELFLTDEEILSFGAEGVTFKLQLRDQDNAPVEFIYKDCRGLEQYAETIRVTFIDCETQNDSLNEIC